jgi:hypothetical protein
MADAAYSGLLATGHIDGTILLGELTSAPNSVTRPLPFMRDLYCVGGNYQPLTGSAATALGCPASGNRATFVTRTTRRCSPQPASPITPIPSSRPTA